MARWLPWERCHGNAARRISRLQRHNPNYASAFWASLTAFGAALLGSLLLRSPKSHTPNFGSAFRPRHSPLWAHFHETTPEKLARSFGPSPFEYLKCPAPNFREFDVLPAICDVTRSIPTMPSVFIVYTCCSLAVSTNPRGKIRQNALQL